jgi:hypothetical protein
MNQCQILYRCFQHDDIPEILRIQNDNLLINLSPLDQSNGYLSVSFTAEQFKEMNSEIPIIVADLGSGLGGYLCSSSLEYSKQVLLLSYMMKLFKKITYRNRPIDSYRSFIYGPVCIDRPLRGRVVTDLNCITVKPVGQFLWDKHNLMLLAGFWFAQQ